MHARIVAKMCRCGLGDLAWTSRKNGRSRHSRPVAALWDGGDDPYDPDYLEQVIAAVGGNPVDWASRTQSVGVPGIFSEEKTVMKQTAAVLADAKSEGAQLVVSACNLSHMLLDVYQGKAGKTTGQETKVPTIHLTELLAFAFGHHIDRLAQLRTRVLVIGD